MFKTSMQKNTAPVHPHDVPEAPWHTVALDLIGPLPESQGYDAILTVIDKFTKKAFFLPTTSMVMSMGTAKLYQDHVFHEHGLPKKMISDRGTQFLSHFMKELQIMLKIEQKPSTAYHPQTDGQADAIIKEKGTSNFPSQRKQSAFSPKFKGPFEVVEPAGPVAYCIKLSMSWKIHDVFMSHYLKNTKSQLSQDKGKPKMMS